MQTQPKSVITLKNFLRVDTLCKFPHAIFYEVYSPSFDGMKLYIRTSLGFLQSHFNNLSNLVHKFARGKVLLFAEACAEYEDSTQNNQNSLDYEMIILIHYDAVSHIRHADLTDCIEEYLEKNSCVSIDYYLWYTPEILNSSPRFLDFSVIHWDFVRQRLRNSVNRITQV
jgi:hypothetical protein